MIVRMACEEAAGSIPEGMEALLQQVADTAAEMLEIPADREISVVLTDNAEIQELNAMYRNIDAPTDVLSFALNEEGEDEPFFAGEDQTLLGDIVISVERAKQQAGDYGHSLEREMGFLLCHGILHLLGYDHMTEEDEREMFGWQDKILSRAKLER